MTGELTSWPERIRRKECGYIIVQLVGRAGKGHTGDYFAGSAIMHE